eukprot:790585-Rhodomonas_salina.1
MAAHATTHPHPHTHTDIDMQIDTATAMSDLPSATRMTSECATAKSFLRSATSCALLSASCSACSRARASALRGTCVRSNSSSCHPRPRPSA